MQALLYRTAVVALVALVAPLAGPHGTSIAADLDIVNVGAVTSVTDAPFLIAQREGYFREAGIKANITNFASGAAMIAPLGAGQLDVAGGAPAAGLYNAMGRGIAIKIVADRAHVAPGYGFNPVIVRKDLVTSGKYKKIADLRGMKVAESGKGSTTAPELEHFLAKGGLSYDDVQHVYLAFPEQIAALKNGSIDAALALEPWGTKAVREGVGVVVASNDRFYPDQQVSTVLYSGDFMKKRPDVAKRFMVAYLRGVRFYNDALRAGHFTGPTAEDVIAILSEELKLDRATLHEMVPGGIDPDGRVNLKSLEDDYAMFKRIGLTTADVDVASVVDMHFAEAAAKQLGPYRPRK